jgi:hypothetical protein
VVQVLGGFNNVAFLHDLTSEPGLASDKNIRTVFSLQLAFKLNRNMFMLLSKAKWLFERQRQRIQQDSENFLAVDRSLKTKTTDEFINVKNLFWTRDCRPSQIVCCTVSLLCGFIVVVVHELTIYKQNSK